MLVGSLLHLACPVLLIYIIKFVEHRAATAAIVSNATLPTVCIARDISRTYHFEKQIKPAAAFSDYFEVCRC